MRLSSFSILVIFLALMLAGLAFVPDLNISLKPTKNYKTLQVDYSWINASPRVIEQNVTSKLEGLFSTVNGIKNIDSESGQGFGQITIDLKKNSNLDAIRFELATIIRRVYNELPEQVSYPVISATSGNNYDNNKKTPLLIYTLNANVSPYFIQKYAIDNISPKIAIIKGINSVQVSGANPFNWEIKYNLNAIRSLGISANDIAHAINNYFDRKIIGLADIDMNSNKHESVKIVLQNNIPQKINWNIIPIKNINGRIIHLQDIAQVRFKEGQPSSYFRINGLNTINIVINSAKGVNIIKLASKVRNEMKKIKEQLPDGYSLLLSNDSSLQVSKELRKILIRTILSLLILFFFVIVVSRQLRYLLLITASLFANLLLAVLLYKFFNVEIHLYSLAGITISFGIIIDNSIIMIEHLKTKGDKKVFLAILASTLTTIGSLSIIFMLPQQQKNDLLDFAIVIIINLFVSLVVALFFIPSLVEKLPLKTKAEKFSMKRKRRIVKFSAFYERFILRLKKYKLIPILLFVLVFGLPVNKIPDKINKQTKFASFYNKTLGCDWFVNTAKPMLYKFLGGTLRYFTDFVSENARYSDPGRTTLNVFAKMPEGCTIIQMNETLKKMENYLSSFKQIDMFKTIISSNRYGSISILFKPKYEMSDFPYYLKNILIKKAISLGGADWSIFGVGKGFSNSLNIDLKMEHIKLTGYNYDQLMKYAEKLRSKMLKNSRIDDVDITGYTSWFSSEMHEFILTPNENETAINKIYLSQMYTPLSNILFNHKIYNAYYQHNLYPVVLKSSQNEDFDFWHLRNYPLLFGNKYQKIPNLASIKFAQKNNTIYRTNQVYRLVLNYNFNGSPILSQHIKKKFIRYISDIMPVGFRCEKSNYMFFGFDITSKSNFKLLLFIILIIYFICSILFESFNQPFTIIFMIPVSFIGIFLTFILFKFGFDQGGFASFILLSGITVNSGIYIINDFNKYGNKSIHYYVKAFDYKIYPILLTILSTILGLLPFIYNGKNDTFWFSFAVGAIGGLVFSFISIFIYLPLFLKMKK